MATRLLPLLAGAAAAAVLAGAPAARADQVFFGNLHAHTSYSDGSGTPDEAYRHARHVAGLDFLAITEHNHAQAESGAGDRQDGILIARTPSLYNGTAADSLISAAGRWSEEGHFVALYGQEFSSISKGNHVNVFEVGEVIDVANGDFGALLSTWIPAHPDSGGQPAIVQLNHPALLDNPDVEYGADDFPSRQEWIRKLDERARLIEVVNGPAMLRGGLARPAEVMEKDYLDYLRLGLHLAPTADQDNHYATWGSATDARTAVIAERLTKPALLAALRARHVYATEDRNLRIVFKVNGHLCGDRLAAPAPNSELAITYSIQDDDEPSAAYRIQVIQNRIGGQDDVEAAALFHDGNTSSGVITGVRYGGGAQYVLFKVTQLGDEDDRAWTAPVWLEPAAGVPPITPSPDADLVASRRSDVYHVSPSCRSAQQIAPANRVTGPAAKEGRRKHFGCPQV